jgi:methionyl-tRNA synthetase
MKNNILTLAVLSVAMTGLWGCSEEVEPAKTFTTPTPSVSMPEKVETDAKPMMEAATEAVQESADQMAEAASETADSAVEEAMSLIEKVKEYIANSDFDLAGKTLEQLTAMKSMLPESVQGQIDSLEQLLATQKTASEGAASVDAMKDKMPAIGQ